MKLISKCYTHPETERVICKKLWLSQSFAKDRLGVVYGRVWDRSVDFDFNFNLDDAGPLWSRLAGVVESEGTIWRAELAFDAGRSVLTDNLRARSSINS